MSFSNNLMIARKQMNFSSKEMAQKLEISPSTYSNYETGYREPDFKTLIKIVQILKVSADALLGINSTEKDEFYLKKGIKIMEDFGYTNVVNPFDYYDYGEFNLCFIVGATDYWYLPTQEEYHTFISFKKSRFIYLMEYARDTFPELSLEMAQRQILMNYVIEFSSYGTNYNEWLNDLEKIREKTELLHPDIYQNNYNAMREFIQFHEEHNTLTRGIADIFIKNVHNLSHIYNEDCSLYAADDPNNPYKYDTV